MGEPKGKVDCTLTLDDEDMVALVTLSLVVVLFTAWDIYLFKNWLLQVTGKLNAQKAYMQGKLKIKGNIMLTQKLQALLKDQSKL